MNNANENKRAAVRNKIRTAACAAHIHNGVQPCSGFSLSESRPDW